MSNSPIFKTAMSSSVVNMEYISTYDQIRNKKNVHKSLDFSNVGIAPENGGATNKHLRQFHQTRLYIKDFGGMYHHTAQQETNTYLISANLPESLSYKIGSRWEAPLSNFGNPMFNAMMQTIGTKAGGNFDSGVNRASTLKIWNGSEPLSLSLRIPVIDDGYENNADATGINTNFVEALEFLGSLCLPSRFGEYGFYTPPPSPLKMKIQYGKEAGQNLEFGPINARIMLQLGGMLLVDNCIIEGISVEYPNTKTMIRHWYPSSQAPGQSGSDYLVPLLAVVTIELSTIEAMTANTYSNMLWLKHQTYMGTGNVDTSKVTAGSIASSIQDMIKMRG